VLPASTGGDPGVASGKKNGGGAHRGGRVTVGRRKVVGAATFRWEGGVLGAVMQLAAEAGKVVVGAASERDE
jgi:hypothetical protein